MKNISRNLACLAVVLGSLYWANEGRAEEAEFVLIRKKDADRVEMQLSGAKNVILAMQERHAEDQKAIEEMKEGEAMLMALASIPSGTNALHPFSFGMGIGQIADNTAFGFAAEWAPFKTVALKATAGVSLEGEVQGVGGGAAFRF